ncbi:MAG: outer membrane protein assembly factor BamA [Alphaproteobacteria bacterium]|nr:outer membrane protein assembly factor BamA [Alphaproteobacteria bacterium]
MVQRYLFLAIVLLATVFATDLRAQAVVQSIEVEGNRRVETPTIMSYINIKPGETVTKDKIDEILKNLYATSLFADVVIDQKDNRLLIKVVENKIINRIAFEGNDKLKDEILLTEVGLRPREVYTPARAQEAAQKIRDMYRLSGRYGAKVEPKIIEREQSRVDLIFEISEGKLTQINKIIFVGNNRFSSSQLGSVILTKESRWYRFFSSDDTYDPDRLSFDKELLRRYYRQHGYADFKVESVVAELDPDEQEFYITYTIDEGQRYRFGHVNIIIELPRLKAQGLKEVITVEKDEWFNSKEIEKTIDKLSGLIGEKGFAFVEIEPKFKRNPETLTVDVDLVVKEGRHVYINRIEITGNDRTDDNVIRREFRLIEGDAFNSVKLKRTEQKLENLDFFKKVEIKQEETAVPDKIDLKVEVEDKPTGSLQFSGGFSTIDGPLGSVTMNERNLMGKGYDLYASAMVSKRAQDFHTGFTNPYFLGKPLSGGIDAFHTSRKYISKSTGSGGYRQMKTGGSVSMGYDLMDRLGQAWSYTLRRDDIGDISRKSSPFLLAQRGVWVVSNLGHNLFFDKRNSSILPSKGYYVGLANDIAGLGGDVQYFKNALRAGGYISLDEESKWVLAIKGSVGVMSGLGKITRVVDRYELGGDSLRGFYDGGVGPRDMRTKDALNGLYYYKGTAEVIFPLGLPAELGINGTAFTDVGAVWHPGNKSPFIKGDTPRPRVGIGAGVNWRSPFGLIGATYAPWAWGVKHVDRKQQFNITFGSNF